MKRTGLVLAALCLAGCADAFDRDVDGLIGQPVQNVVARLGPPEVARTADNGPTYSWVSSRQGESDPAGPPSASRCRIEAKTDRQGVIYATRYSGNLQNCAGFEKALHRRR
jgi:hypothetical protein